MNGVQFVGAFALPLAVGILPALRRRAPRRLLVSRRRPPTPMERRAAINTVGLTADAVWRS